MDREIGDYEAPREIVEKVFDSASAVLLVKRDDYFPEDLSHPVYPASFENVHKRSLETFFEQTGLKDAGKKELIYLYNDQNSASILQGSVVFAGTDPYDINPYITLQVSSFGHASPLYILKPRSTILDKGSSYDLSINGDKKTVEFTGAISNAQIYKMINKIYLNAVSGKVEFPKRDEDPFLLIARDLSKINYSDFSRF